MESDTLSRGWEEGFIEQPSLERGIRRSTGVYYTPFSLAERIVERCFEYFPISPDSSDAVVSVLDPACGNGVFLAAALKYFASHDFGLRLALSGVDIDAGAVQEARRLLETSLTRLPSSRVALRLWVQDFLDYEAGKYHVIIGNPPWVVIRNLPNREQQTRIKRLMRRLGLWDGAAHLATQLDLATIFLWKCATCHLEDEGVLGLVMPSSVATATAQHRLLLERLTRQGFRVSVWDLSKEENLFPSPACVVFLRRTAKAPSGRPEPADPLPYHSTPLSSTETQLTSPYYSRFMVGASIFPRCFYLVQVIDEAGDSLTIQTHPDVFKRAKDPWKIQIQGRLHRRHLFRTLIAQDLLPFGVIRDTLVALPVEILGEDETLLVNLTEERLGVSMEWFSRCEEEWARRRSEASAEWFPTLWERLNYQGLLTKQFPTKRFVVCYSATGSNPTAAVIDRRRTTRLVLDVKTWYLQTNDEDEAFYLAGVINSGTVVAEIRHRQPRGLYGPRAIHRLPLSLPVPLFARDNPIHLNIANLAKEAAALVERSLGSLKRRQEVRAHLTPLLAQMDGLVGRLLKEVECRQKESNKVWQPRLFE